MVAYLLGVVVELSRFGDGRIVWAMIAALHVHSSSKRRANTPLAAKVLSNKGG